VARPAGSKYPDGPAIPCQSSCRRLQEPVEDGWLDLALEKGRHRVSKVRRVKIERSVQRGIEGRVEAHQSLSMSLAVLAAL
jgi:hypothetical protein